MDSRRTRVIKLTGLPEVLRRGEGSARVIDATARPPTISVRQRTRHSIATSPQPRPHLNSHPHPHPHKTTPPQSRSQPNQHTHTHIVTPPQSRSQPNQHSHPHIVTPSQPRSHPHPHIHSHQHLHSHPPPLPQPQSLPQTLSQANPQPPPPLVQSTISRSCTPNILHPHKITSPPQQPTQRRAASLSPAPVNDQHLEDRFERLESELKNISKQFEQFYKIYFERTNSTSSSQIHFEEEDPLADVSMASRDYLCRNNLF